MRTNWGTALAGFAAAAVLAAPVQAELVGFTLDDFPDVFSSFLDVTYDAAGATGDLQAHGFAFQYDQDGDPTGKPIVDGRFDMSIDINKMTGEANSGNVEISGEIPILGFNGPTLLSGFLTDFGFIDGGGMIVDALFEVTGGDLASDYGGIGGTFGVILDVNTRYTGDWSVSFDNLIAEIPGTGSGESNTAPVPGPSAIGLLLAAGVLGSRRRRSA